MKAIVVAFERLPWSVLGCYGCDWVPTPNFDRLSARSLVFDEHFLTRVGERLPWWEHRQAASQEGPSFFARLAAGGVECRALVDSIVAAGWDDGPVPEVAIGVGGEVGLDVPEARTPIGRLADRAERELEHLADLGGRPWLLCLGSAGVPDPWIPPREDVLACLQASEEQPSEAEGEELDEQRSSLDEIDLPTALEAAEIASRHGFDAELPAELLELALLMFGAYVVHLDRCFGKLLDAIDAHVAPEEELLLLVGAARGERVASRSSSELSEECCRTPLLLSGSAVTSGRCRGLVQTCDWLPTLLEWFGLEGPAGGPGRSLLPLCGHPEAPFREFVRSESNTGRTLVRTPHFAMHAGPPDRAEEAEAESVQLFSKPDDLWEVLDVAEQYPDVVEQLRELAQ